MATTPPPVTGFEEPPGELDFAHLYDSLGGLVRRAGQALSLVPPDREVKEARPLPPGAELVVPGGGAQPVKLPPKRALTKGPVDLNLHDRLAEAEAARQGVDPALVKRIIARESSGRGNAVSARGAAGLMGLMPDTAASLGVKDLTDPTQNIRGGVTYLKQLLDRFGGDEAAALAAYNRGPTWVEQARKQHGAGWLRHAPAETRRYVSRLTERSPDFTGIPGHVDRATSVDVTHPAHPARGWVDRVTDAFKDRLPTAAELVHVRADLNAVADLPSDVYERARRAILGILPDFKPNERIGPAGATISPREMLEFLLPPGLTRAEAKKARAEIVAVHGDVTLSDDEKIKKLAGNPLAVTIGVIPVGPGKGPLLRRGFAAELAEARNIIDVKPTAVSEATLPGREPRLSADEPPPTDFQYYSQRLIDKDLLAGAVKAGGINHVPIGGARRSGFGATYGDLSRAEAIAQELTGKKGFLNPRVEQGITEDKHGYTVTWGETLPKFEDRPEVHAERGRLLGYSPRSIQQFIATPSHDFSAIPGHVAHEPLKEPGVPSKNDPAAIWADNWVTARMRLWEQAYAAVGKNKALELMGGYPAGELPAIEDPLTARRLAVQRGKALDRLASDFFDIGAENGFIGREPKRFEAIQRAMARADVAMKDGDYQKAIEHQEIALSAMHDTMERAGEGADLLPGGRKGAEPTQEKIAEILRHKEPLKEPGPPTTVKDLWQLQDQLRANPLRDKVMGLRATARDFEALYKSQAPLLDRYVAGVKEAVRDLPAAERRELLGGLAEVERYLAGAARDLHARGDAQGAISQQEFAGDHLHHILDRLSEDRPAQAARKLRGEVPLKDPGAGPGAEDLYKAGYSVGKIAKTLGIPYEKVFEKLKKAGLVKPIDFGGEAPLKDPNILKVKEDPTLELSRDPGEIKPVEADPLKFPAPLRAIADKLQISDVYLATQKDGALGLNVGRAWHKNIVDTLVGHGWTRAAAERTARHDVVAALMDMEGVTPAQVEEIADHIIEGQQDIIVVDPLTDKQTVTHEVMHSLTFQELPNLTDTDVKTAQIKQLFGDVYTEYESPRWEMLKESYLDGNENIIEWFHRGPEYYTEVMTQYFTGNLRPGSPSQQLAETILRNSQTPWVRDLVGLAFALALGVKLTRAAARGGDEVERPDFSGVAGHVAR